MKQESLLRIGPQDFAHAAKGVSLFFIHGQEFKAMTQAVPIPHQSANLYGMSYHGQRQFQRNHFSDLQLTGKSRSNTVQP